MSKDVKAYRAATRRAEEARAKFLADLATVRGSVSPARLKAEIRAGARERAQLAAMGAKRSMRRHGWSIAGVVAVLTAWRFRRRLAALSRHLWVETQRLWHHYQERRHDHDR
jgi:hypothetical protein